MKMSTKEKIEQYTDWFSQRIKFIKGIGDDDTTILVCCTLIDALGKCAQPERGSKERFINLLELFGNNDIWTRVSICHLVSEGNKYIKGYQDLTTYTCEKLKWVDQNDCSNPYTVDPKIDTIQNEIRALDFANKFMKFCQKYKYSTYFYERYRCGLVHEAKILRDSTAWDYTRENRPHYIRYTPKLPLNSQPIETKKHLIFPSTFIADETIKINNQLKEWLTKQNINPYERYGLE